MKEGLSSQGKAGEDGQSFAAINQDVVTGSDRRFSEAMNTLSGSKNGSRFEHCHRGKPLQEDRYRLGHPPVAKGARLRRTMVAQCTVRPLQLPAWRQSSPRPAEAADVLRAPGLPEAWVWLWTGASRCTCGRGRCKGCPGKQVVRDEPGPVPWSHAWVRPGLMARELPTLRMSLSSRGGVLMQLRAAMDVGMERTPAQRP